MGYLVKDQYPRQTYWNNFKLKEKKSINSSATAHVPSSLLFLQWNIIWRFLHVLKCIIWCISSKGVLLWKWLQYSERRHLYLDNKQLHRVSSELIQHASESCTTPVNVKVILQIYFNPCCGPTKRYNNLSFGHALLPSDHVFFETEQCGHKRQQRVGQRICMKRVWNDEHHLANCWLLLASPFCARLHTNARVRPNIALIWAVSHYQRQWRISRQTYLVPFM